MIIELQYDVLIPYQKGRRMQMHDNEKKKITKHLIIRLLLVLVLCAGIFGFSAYLSNRRSSDTIETVSDLYMHSMSEEIAFHVEMVISLYLSLIHI